MELQDLSAEETEIRRSFQQASQLKEQARTSLDHLDCYVAAANLFQNAATLSTKLAETPLTPPNERIQHRAFSAYYSYEEHNSLGAYYYEKHEPENATEHHQLATQYLHKAITIIKNPPVDVSREAKNHLASFLKNWQHFHRETEFHLLAIKGRAAWDDGRYIEALDFYRTTAKKQKQFIENPDFQNISQQYQRIALGNFIGQMANASSALAAHLLSKARSAPDGGEIPFDLLVKLVKYTLDAYRYSEAAYEQNPEWDQYRTIGQLCLRNIQIFLMDHPCSAQQLAAVLYDDRDFLRILNLTKATMDEQPSQKIKILFVNANPLADLQLDEEMRAIVKKIRAAEHRDSIDIVVAHAARPDDLLQVLNEHQPHVVHFSGHGNSQGQIILVDDNGHPKPVSKDALVSLFDSVKGNVKLVMLNSCYSRAQADAVVSVIPCAVGMNESIGDHAARIFSASFYRAIGFGKSVEEAFKQGLTALRLEGIGEDHIPELILQSGIDPRKLVLVEP